MSPLQMLPAAPRVVLACHLLLVARPRPALRQVAAVMLMVVVLLLLLLLMMMMCP